MSLYLTQYPINIGLKIMNNNKGLWIPIDLILNKNITFQEKIILVEINQLTMLDKGCIASNRHFSELFQIKRESISRSISSLENKGYITSKIRKGSRNFDRTITINNLLLYSKQIVKSAITNCLESKENNTFNNTINNIVNIVASQEAKPTVTRSLKIIDLANIPELTQDKVILDMPTENQIDAIKTITKNYEVDGSKLFDTIMELSNTKADYFEDFNQILAIAINQQLGRAYRRLGEALQCLGLADPRADIPF